MVCPAHGIEDHRQRGLTDLQADDHGIRLLGPDDLAAFKQIRLEALRLEEALFGSSLSDWQRLDDAAWRERLTANAVFVAFRSGEPAGIMGLSRQRPVKMAHRATVIMVYVRASERGNGLAGELLRAVEAHARGEGILQLELTVSSENPVAQRFYERMGYREMGRIPAGVIDRGREIDDVLMFRRIEEARQ